MNTLMIVLRWLHIFSAVYWVGAGLATTFVIVPAVGATGDAGRQFTHGVALQATWMEVVP